MKRYRGEITETDVGEIKASSDLADELQFAPLADLKGRATSESAASLVSLLADAYPRTTKDATRSNKPRKLWPQIHAAIAAFLADLLMAQGNEEAEDGSGFRSHKNNFKKPAPVSYRTFKAFAHLGRQRGLSRSMRAIPASWVRISGAKASDA